MWVKKYHQTLKSMNTMPASDLKKSLEYFLSFLKSHIEIEEAKNLFIDLLHGKIRDAMFEYFPEMKQYTDEIENEFNAIIDKHYEEIFDDALAVIFQFIDNPIKSDEGFHSHKRWESDEVLKQEAEKYALKVHEEIRENFRESFFLSLKNLRHYSHFGDIVHEKILACVTDIFEDIPELSGNGIRYFDSVMWDKSVWLFDDLKSILANRTIEPYDDDLPYMQMKA